MPQKLGSGSRPFCVPDVTYMDLAPRLSPGDRDIGIVAELQRAGRVVPKLGMTGIGSSIPGLVTCSIVSCGLPAATEYLRELEHARKEIPTLLETRLLTRIRRP